MVEVNEDILATRFKDLLLAWTAIKIIFLSFQVLFFSFKTKLRIQAYEKIEFSSENREISKQKGSSNLSFLLSVSFSVESPDYAGIKTCIFCHVSRMSSLFLEMG